MEWVNNASTSFGETHFAEGLSLSRGFKGISLLENKNKWIVLISVISSSPVFPIFQACEDLDMCIFVHPWWWMAKEKMPKYWAPWLVGMPMETSLAICSMIFSGVFEKLKNLRVAFAHGGGAFPMTIGRIEHGFNVRPDLVAIDNAISPKKYLGKFWLDSLVHDKKVLQYITNVQNRKFSEYPYYYYLLFILILF